MVENIIYKFLFKNIYNFLNRKIYKKINMCVEFLKKRNAETYYFILKLLKNNSASTETTSCKEKRAYEIYKRSDGKNMISNSENKLFGFFTHIFIFLYMFLNEPPHEIRKN